MEMVSMVGNRHALMVVGLILAILLSGGLITQVSGQAGSQDLVMTNMNVTATLDTECTTSLVIESEVSNVGATSFDYFDLRIDVRSLNVSSASLNGTPTTTTI